MTTPIIPDNKSVRRKLYEASNANGYILFEETAKIIESSEGTRHLQPNLIAVIRKMAEALDDSGATLAMLLANVPEWLSDHHYISLSLNKANKALAEAAEFLKEEK